MSRTDTESPARPAAALSCCPKWRRRPWDSPGRMGNRGRCRKTCKVRGERHRAPPPRTLGPLSANRAFVLPKKFTAASSPAAARSAPCRAPAFTGQLPEWLGRPPGAGPPAPRRRQDPGQEMQLRPGNRQTSGRWEPSPGCRRPAGHCSGTPSPLQIQGISVSSLVRAKLTRSL